jgi:hypothetical protein
VFGRGDSEAKSNTLGLAAANLGWEHRGFNLPTWTENGLYESGPALEQLARTGANSVSFAPYWYQRTVESNQVFRTNYTSTDESLVWAIQKARSLGLKVSLHPLLDSQDLRWRAYIKPTDPDAWFKSYGDMMKHYADLGRDHGAELLVLGDELITVATDPDNEARWRTLISEIRSRFRGKLTYAANWGGNSFDEEYARIAFWDALDYMAFAGYFEVATSANPTLEELDYWWQFWRETKLRPLYEQWGKPLLFVEVGFRSGDGAARQPWNAWDTMRPDQQEQADCWESFFASWANVPWFAGAHGWAWTTNTQISPTDTGYEVQNKPAMQTVTRWFGGSANRIPTVVPRPPTIRIEAPLSNESYSGRIVVQAFSRDATAVTYRVDEGPRRVMTFNRSSGLWEAPLDTSTLQNGPHHVTVVAESSGASSSEDRAWNILISNAPGTPAPQGGSGPR